MNNQLKVLGTKHIGKITFTGIEGGFGPGKKEKTLLEFIISQLEKSIEESITIVSGLKTVSILLT